MSTDSSLPQILVDYSDVTSITERGSMPLLLETFFYALDTVLIAYFIYKRRMDRRAMPQLPMFMFCVAVAMFILFSLYWVTDVYLLWAAVYRYLPHQATVREDTYLDGIWISWSAPYFIQQISLFSMIVFGDVVSLWRAYVILSRPRWLFLLSIGLGILESGLYILVLVEYLAEELPHFARGFYDFSENSNNPSITAAGLFTGCVQLFATSLIVWKAWAYWRNVKEFSRQYQVRHGIATLAVVIESGVVYLALLFWYGSAVIFAGEQSLALALVYYYATPLIAMYPSLVVVLGATRRSVLERSIDMMTSLPSNVRSTSAANTSVTQVRTRVSQYSQHPPNRHRDDSLERRSKGIRLLEVNLRPTEIELDGVRADAINAARRSDATGGSDSDGKSCSIGKPCRAVSSPRSNEYSRDNM